MFKKIELWLVLLLILVITLFFGVLVRQELEGKRKLGLISLTALEISRLPARISWLLNSENIDPQRTPSNSLSKKIINKVLNEYSNNALYLISRYDASIKKSIVELRKIKNFDLLHTYYVNQNIIFENLKIVENRLNLKKENYFGKRFQIDHPLILNDGSIIAKGGGALFRLNLCDEIMWVNNDIIVHHSNNFDNEGNIWSPSFLHDKTIRKNILKDDKNFIEDGITKFSPEGKMLFNKSLISIFQENNLQGLIFGIDRKLFNDPTHLNDIEIASNDTKFWKKNDLFFSLRHRSVIIHYRPENNKIINVIHGPMGHQHDVDFFSEKEISIFNNNNFSNLSGESNTKNNELLIYNFETKNFYNEYENAFKKLNIKTPTAGLSDRLNDGSLLVEETDFGRVVYLTKDEQVIWEFNNIFEEKNYRIGWGRVIEEKKLIDDVIASLENKNCPIKK
jgi:hypothetical protein